MSVNHKGLHKWKELILHISRAGRMESFIRKVLGSL